MCFEDEHFHHVTSIVIELQFDLTVVKKALNKRAKPENSKLNLRVRGFIKTKVTAQ